MISQSELLYAWAVAYRQAGFNVVPAKNKRPLVDWKFYQDRMVPLEQVQEWFSGCPENAQIALITGKISGVSVLDIDCHKAGCPSKGGQACNCHAEHPENILRRYDLTMTSKTGSGGFHAFFKYEPTLSNSVKLLDPQLDVRSDGGIIILPPSIHHVNKRAYAWDDLMPWNANNLGALAQFPKELLATAVARPQPNWLRIVRGGGQGSRNMNAAQLTGLLLNSFKEVNLVEEVWELLKLWNKDRNKPPLAESELRRTFESIAKIELTKDGKQIVSRETL